MIMMRIPAVAVAAFTLACGPSAVPTPAPAAADALREQLMQADRDFAAETLQRRLDGWMASYAEDAARVVLGDSAVRGLQNIRESDARIFADSAMQLLWEPTDAGVFAGGNLGFTTGVSAYVRTNPGTSVVDTVSTGRYVTIWRRGDDGQWQIVLDTGT